MNEDANKGMDAGMDEDPQAITNVYVRFSDRTYRIDAVLIAQHRARYYANQLSAASESHQAREYEEELTYALTHFDVLVAWAANNMNWDDVESEAVRVGVAPLPPNLDDEWSTGQAVFTAMADD